VDARGLRRVLTVVSVLALVATVYLSLEPASQSGIDDGRDKVEHLTTYAALTLWFTGFVPRERSLPIALGLAALGGVLELLQAAMQLGRSAEWLDFAANCTGVGLGWLVARTLSGGWACRVTAGTIR
jgi:VanZ family protein